MKTRHSALVIFIVASWVGLAQSWGGGRRAEDKTHTLAWQAFSADMGRGDCTMDSLSEQASVTLPIGQTVTKDELEVSLALSLSEATTGAALLDLLVAKPASWSLFAPAPDGHYRLACENSMGDTTVGETSLHDGKLVSIDRVNFSVEAMVTAKATSLKTGFQQDVSYPAAFFMTIDLRTNKARKKNCISSLPEVRMYAQNIALLAARGYTMIPSSTYGPVIRPV
ncbi:unnamed protein product [Ectocarpus sp. 13 AM-2016]